jgi:glucosamine-6-phosphate deaminase
LFASGISDFKLAERLIEGNRFWRRIFVTTENTEIKHLKIGTLKVEIHPNRKAAGTAAAHAIAQTLRHVNYRGAGIGVIFAAAASQLDTLQALIGIEGLPWDQVQGFHMDEYIGIGADHPASFRHFLRENLTQQIHMKDFFEIDGSTQNPGQVCREYAKQLNAANPELCLLGIGENGHLAFNDPPEANFNDPLDVKIVRLDSSCRQQQVAEGWFKSIEEVPESAVTLTIPALLRVPKLIASVPGSRKAKIMRLVLEAPISTECPATILRTHPDATVYLDAESASELGGV